MPKHPFVSTLVVTIALAACGPDGEMPATCAPRNAFTPTGFFRVESDCGRAWLVDPAGRRFYSTGVNHVSWDGDYSPRSQSNPYADAARARYGSEAAWADATAARLVDWGWNTVGAWSSYPILGARMPYTVMLTLAQADWRRGSVPDYYAPAWAEEVERRVEALVPARVGDPLLVGWFLDNELRWGPDWRSGEDLFATYLRMDAAAPGKQALVELLRGRHGGEIARFNEAWGTTYASFDELAQDWRLPAPATAAARADRSAFVEALAERFFSVTAGAVRARDPDHLLLGVRFVASLLPVEVAAAAGRHLDVVSVNAYEYVFDPAGVFRPEVNNFADLEVGGFLEAVHRAARRPLLVSEFGFRAADAGLPNSWPPVYPTLATQAERADRFEAYARRCQGAPWIVGYHWFEHADQPPAGRFDGEDNNWGLVTVGDDPYPTLVERSRLVNPTTEEAIGRLR